MSKKLGNTKIDRIKHKDTRRNAPTEQTADFVEDEYKKPINCRPKIKFLEPGAPRLSWQRGEPEGGWQQKARPLYVQEKIHPFNFVQSLTEQKSGGGGGGGDLFADFNGVPENAHWEWYRHDGYWQNRIIRADSVRAMASMKEHDGLAGKVQMVYYDPPYGINFKSNFQVDSRSRENPDGIEGIPNDPPTTKAFRDCYGNGIHSYLDMIQKNMVFAYDLLTDSGSIFLQIGNDNMTRIALILDEVFGADNRIAIIPFRKTGSSASTMLPEVCDYILWYAKYKQAARDIYKQLYLKLNRKELISRWNMMIEEADGSARALTEDEMANPNRIPANARIFQRMPLTSMGRMKGERSQPFTYRGAVYECGSNGHWRVSHSGLGRLGELDRLSPGGGGGLYWKRYEDEVPGRKNSNLWETKMSPSDLHYVVETAEAVVERCILMTTDPGDLVLDITCGSGTTAYVAEKWGRRWITTDTSATAVALTRQRLACATFPYYLLMDSKEGAKQEAALGGTAIDMPHEKDIKMGFVYERVPTVSAAVLAYDQVVPPTLLVNRPYAKGGVVRVTCPFTVETESPHRYLPMSDRHDDAGAQIGLSDEQNRTKCALERSGIKVPQSISADGRIKFRELEEYIAGRSIAQGNAGEPLITHTGTMIIMEKKGGKNGGKRKQSSTQIRCAVVMAPDDTTVPQAWIDRAANEAIRIEGVETLIVIGFQFEGGVIRTPMEKRGKLRIVKAQANRDLAVTELADSKDDNSFVMLAEPDVQLIPVGNSKIKVKLHGWHTYDPADGNIRSGGKSDIECWMVDTDYDGKSFMCRDLHFPHPTDKQLKCLHQELGSKLDSQAWKAMTTYESVPFVKPRTGRVAVRIITTTGTEMSTVLDLE